MLTVDDCDSEIGAKQFQYRADRRRVEHLFRLRIFARRQSPDSAGAGAKNRVEELCVDFLPFGDEMRKIVRRLEIEKDSHVSARDNEISERDSRLRPSACYGVREIDRDARR